MADFNLKDYEPVQDRIDKFYVKYPDGRILTTLESAIENAFTFKATIYKNIEEQKAGVPFTCGWAREVIGDGYVNKDSALENTETSAIGRALANIGFHGSKRQSQEEMKKTIKKEEPKPKGKIMKALDQLHKETKQTFGIFESQLSTREWTADEWRILKERIGTRKVELGFSGE